MRELYSLVAAQSTPLNDVSGSGNAMTMSMSGLARCFCRQFK